MKLRRIKLSKTFILYVLVGVISYALELTSLFSIHYMFSLSYGYSTAIAFWIGLFSSFVLQKFLAFKDYRKEIKEISSQLSLFSLLVIFNYIFTLIVVSALPSHLILFSRTLALAITTSWNYIIYKKIFSKNRSFNKYFVSIKKYLINKRGAIVFFVLITLPILFFFYQYLWTGNKLIAGDFDYYAQLYEAFRISVLHYHQIPLWNPWMSGGVPLLANPQFGFLSLQSLLVLPFGAIYGLKLAYVTYAVFGFWGTYNLGRSVFRSTKFRSVLISYIFIFCGFFAGHNISHFTTTGFFILPWLVLLLIRHGRRDWLWFGILFSLIMLSAIDFVVLMIAMILAILYVSLFIYEIIPNINNIKKTIKERLYFIIKSSILIIVMCGYRFLISYIYVKNNPRPLAILFETRPGLKTLFDGLFLPIGTLLKVPSHLQWGWAEYSMYMGFGVTIALLFIFIILLFLYIKRGLIIKNLIDPLIIVFIILGLIGFAFAIGNFGKFSPYALLKDLPGYSQTRVSSRWLFLSLFSILMFLTSWKKIPKVINLLLLFSVIELFVSYGPPNTIGQGQITVPVASFGTKFEEYDNGMKHLDESVNIMHSYFYTTSKNIGQIYTDEPMLDTLDKVDNTTKCGLNVSSDCKFILTNNAEVISWSPNYITILRTKPGNINLNMNIESGWEINNQYPFYNIKPIDSTDIFTLPSNETVYQLKYAPKLSIQWFFQKY